jgi:hypothetical protein
MMHEDTVGLLESGKYADMVVLDQNPFDIDQARISELQVLAAIFEGKEVHRARATSQRQGRT